jgi:hypothetical protein
MVLSFVVRRHWRLDISKYFDTSKAKTPGDGQRIPGRFLGGFGPAALRSGRQAGGEEVGDLADQVEVHGDEMLLAGFSNLQQPGLSQDL